MNNYEGPDRRNHQCTQEIVLTEIKGFIMTNTQDTKKILKILDGNGTVGLKTQVELNKTSLNRLLGWLAGVTTALVGIAIYAVQAFIRYR